MTACDNLNCCGLPGGLLQDLKDYLQADWIEPGSSEERRIGELARDGIAYLDDKLGGPGDYMVPGYPRQLLKEYVRYARDAALDVFENNYLGLINAMQNQRRVSAYAADMEGAGPTGL